MFVVERVQTFLGDLHGNRALLEQLCLAPEPRVHADIESLVEDVFLVLFRVAQQICACFDVDVTGGARADPTALLLRR